MFSCGQQISLGVHTLERKSTDMGAGCVGIGEEGGREGINSVKVNDFLLVCTDIDENGIMWRGQCLFSPACSRPTTFLGM